MEKVKKGVLYLISTPLGNLGDITLRALEVLKKTEYLLCEDSRVTQKLLNSFDIIPGKRLVYNDINKKKTVEGIVELLKKGHIVSQVTDAGTPLISDPGYVLVNRVIEEGIEIVPVPGVSAPVAALSVSGFSGNSFYFGGFPPKSGSKRFWSDISEIKSTLIFFESPKRICKTLSIIIQRVGNIPTMVCREMTKMNEEFIRGNVSQVMEELKNRCRIRGEITFLLDNSNVKSEKSSQLPEKVLMQIDNLKKMKLSSRDIIKIVKIFYPGKFRKNILYDYMINS